MASSMAGPVLRLRSGAALPQAGFGTFMAGAGVLESVMVDAIKEGVRLFDTAAVYGNEAEVGAGIRNAIQLGLCKREDLFVTTKVWMNRYQKEDVQPAMEESLRKLGLDYVDMYLIHWPFQVSREQSTFPIPLNQRLGYSPEVIRTVWTELESLLAQGKTKHIGVCNFSVPQLEVLVAHAKHLPDLLQSEFHVLLPQTRVRAYCAANGIVFQSYATLGNPSFPRFQGMPRLMELPAVVEIAKRLAATPAQVLLRHALSHGLAVIPKASSAARVRENFQATALALSPEDIAALDKLGRDSPHRFYDPIPNIVPEGVSRLEATDDSI